MLFSKKIDRCCQFCAHCTNLDEHPILCVKKGVTEPRDNCRAFRYDPCKRVPAKAKALDFDKYKEYDYSL